MPREQKGSAVMAAAGGGGQDDDRGVDGGADGEAGRTKKDDWEMYLRTAEDQERTKMEWETENKDWLEDQVMQNLCCTLVLLCVLLSGDKRREKEERCRVNRGSETLAALRLEDAVVWIIGSTEALDPLVCAVYNRLYSRLYVGVALIC